mmetsp:Transcript_5661/g.7082  ORF Transcript_5661/g.7082 Transcript_5661/m.7082 type:complete len:585 (-) Transcript_5661:293-2047(-)|eukprot:CAMPEP_0172503812 /NCGR_PEP_ID=MMETSP1066-20121228/172492_1 /TAXON_ID=671091 /ORGANISM="Coscinodiscus wailesii, Strain CCMP2513" /LENGTH=584 /DNA_ID=CAMNT_0013279703 /DNA_START=144 /DNA_END=1898 /DNA_ORIENTATION=+
MLKRKFSSDISLRSSEAMKRAGSSMFSIVTILDDTDGANQELGESRGVSGCDEGSRVALAEDGALLSSPKAQVTSSRTARSLSTDSDAHLVSLVSATEHDTDGDSSSDGFFIEDGESDGEGGYGGNVVASATFLPHANCSKRNSTISKNTNESATVTSQSVNSDAMQTTTEEKTESPYFRTGVIFESGEQHYDRYNRCHKERPLRITTVKKHLEGVEVIKTNCSVFGYLNEPTSADRVENLSPERAFLDDDDYLRVHLPGYMKRLDRLSNCACCDKLDREAEQYKSIYFTKDSVNSAKTAATSLCRLVSKVMSGDLDNGFAVIRPPGHHAEPGLAGGYCVINNVAVAAAYAREKLGASKVLIVDWDVHHGNGTQSIFLNDPNVLFFSVHRYHGGNFFPFLQNSGPSTVGLGEGAGFNINVGWNKKKMGDAEYLAVWETILMPVAQEFQPDLVLVSSGFDAADGDMGECHVTPECFGQLTRALMTLADGKVVCALEGGYVRSILARCVESVVRSLLGETTTQKQSDSETTEVLPHSLDSIDKSAAKSILTTLNFHKSYWNSLRCTKNQFTFNCNESSLEEKKMDM